MQVISGPGNKNFIAAVIICCMTIGMILGAMLSQKRTEVRFYEKKLERTVSALGERNARESKTESDSREEMHSPWK